MKTKKTLNEFKLDILKPLKSLFKFIVDKVTNAINSLDFGKKTSVRIDMSTLQEKIDLKSRIGYYAEYVTGYELSKLIEEAGGNLTTERSHPANLKAQMLQKKKELKSLNAPIAEINRMESSGKALAEQIFHDSILGGYDYFILQFDIHLTGVEEKGKSKADLILTIGKMDEIVIVDQINASLKAYKSSSIVLSNNTYISLIKNLFYNPEELKEIGTKISDFIERFVKDYGSKKDITRLYELQRIIISQMSAGKTKEKARLYSKTTHPEVIEIIVRILNQHYKKNKLEVNKRVLKILGLNGEEDFYAAIGEKKQKVLSSRKSEKLRALIKKLQKSYELHFERNKQTKNLSLTFVAPNGEVILSSTVTFSDTGTEGKVNVFVPFSVE